MTSALLSLDDVVQLELPPMGATASGRPWRLRPADPRETLAIAQSAGVDVLVARALVARGVSAAGARTYLNPSLREALPDPFVLQDMELAAKRLAAAIESGETIGVFGDYDVDGTTAAAILARYVRAVGGAVEVYLPDRILEGYGPSIEAFRELARKGVKTIVTVDCGANAHGVIEAAAKDGLDLVVIDHHLMSGPPPEGAVACVNPNRLDDVSGLGGLSAAGLAFLAAIAVNRALRAAGYFSVRAEPDLKPLLDLAALGLVCDVMPMRGLARVLVAQGLKVLGAGGNIGLSALAKQAGVKSASSTYHLGFLLGPRINAAGRIGHARLAFELLTTEDPARAATLAEKLHVMNAERQAIEADVLTSAIAAIDADGAKSEGVLVAAGEGWHPGVIGIVAGRIKDKYDLPTIIIGWDGDVGKGSGRSLSGVDLGGAVSAAKDAGLLIAGGGHAMAAGLTIAREALHPFTAFLAERLGASVHTARSTRVEDADGVLSVAAATGRLALAIERAGPFGPGNPEPQFVLPDVSIRDIRTIGAGHVAARLVGAGGDSVRAIAFRADESGLGAMLRSGKRLHLLGKVKADEWRGGDAAQFQIGDAAAAP